MQENDGNDSVKMGDRVNQRLDDMILVRWQQKVNQVETPLKIGLPESSRCSTTARRSGGVLSVTGCGREKGSVTFISGRIVFSIDAFLNTTYDFYFYGKMRR